MTFEDTKYIPDTPVKKRGNPAMGEIGKKNKGPSPGPRTNTISKIKFKARSYHLPGDIVIGLPAVTIDRDELAEFVTNGAKWGQIENYYQVSQTNLKEHFEYVYNQARAKLEMKLLSGMVKAADEGSASLSKWLSIQWLDMKDAPALTPQSDLSEEEITKQLNAIFNKNK